MAQPCGLRLEVVRPWNEIATKNFFCDIGTHMKRHIFTRLATTIAATAFFIASNPAQAVNTPTFTFPENNALARTLHLPIYVWARPNVQPRAIIVALHGGCLHGRSYKALGEAMAPKDIMVVSMDLRGYGKWYHNGYGSKRDQTFDYVQTKEDLVRIVTELKHRYPEVPICFIGESLGANLSLHMVGGYPHLVDGAILVSTYSAPKIFLHPHMPLSAIEFMAKPFGKLTMEPYIKSRLSDTPDFSIAQINDPRGRDHQTLKEMLQSMSLNEKGKFYATKIPKETWVLMMHGQCDQLCDLGAAMKLFKKIPTHKKTFVLIPGRGHLLVETPELRPEVLEVLNKWMSTHSNHPLTPNGGVGA